MLLLTKRFYIPLLGPNKDPLDKDPFSRDSLYKDPFNKDPFNKDLLRSLV
jgi:hypothetical protein